MKRIDPVNGAPRILIISLSNIGDVILTTPALSLLRERFESAHLTVVVGPKAASLFEGCRMVNEAVVFDKRGSIRDRLNFLSRLRKQKYDLVIDLRNTLIPWLVRARSRSPLAFEPTDGPMRERHLARLGFFLPVPKDVENHFDFFNEEEKRSAFEIARKSASRFSKGGFVAVAPGAGSELKRWTTSGFQAVVRHFLAAGRPAVLLGDPSETALAQEIEEASSSGEMLSNLAGCLSLRQAAALVSEAALVVANDSAVMHLSHELGRPTVSIFGPTDDVHYGRKGPQFRRVRLPIACSPCRKAECQSSYRACLDDLTPKEVIAACEELLNV